MPKVNQVNFTELMEGRQVRGLNGRIGTIIYIDVNDDNYVWVLWENDKRSYGGWYGNNAEVDLLDDLADYESYREAKEALLALRHLGGHSYSQLNNA